MHIARTLINQEGSLSSITETFQIYGTSSKIQQTPKLLEKYEISSDGIWESLCIRLVLRPYSVSEKVDQVETVTSRISECNEESQLQQSPETQKRQA